MICRVTVNTFMAGWREKRQENRPIRVDLAPLLKDGCALFEFSERGTMQMKPRPCFAQGLCALRSGFKADFPAVPSPPRFAGLPMACKGSQPEDADEQGEDQSVYQHGVTGSVVVIYSGGAGTQP